MSFSFNVWKRVHVHAQRHHGAREVFLGRGTAQAEAACLLRPVPVVSRRVFAEAPPANNDVLICEYLYDETAQARPRFQVISFCISRRTCGIR